ncbi:ORF20 [Fowl aviadenovirus C]|uniref:ORF20 n=1 Tax=Fowl aviadenovirus C TaxID=190063 RepID=H8WQX2_9ADEN|nr:ORF20 [Fowl aviadenovirus C]CCE39380.1 ORF20 [Fowl aviadenovirus C]
MECGCCSFSVLVPPPREPIVLHQEEIERMIEYHLTLAILDLNTFNGDEFLRYIHSSIYVAVGCRCSRYLRLRSGVHLVVNCDIRFQTAIPLTASDKREFLQFISRRLFNVPPEIRAPMVRWMERKRKTDFIFVPSGLVLGSMVCCKMALRTMCFEISTSKVPRCVPFMEVPINYLECCKTNVRMTLVCPRGNGSCITQSICTKSMLVDFVPLPYREIVFRGVCYLPAHRRATYSDMEEWFMHVHGPFCDCENGCDRCEVKSPMNLFYLAQMACLKLAFDRRRARVTHNRKSPFFK